MKNIIFLTFFLLLSSGLVYGVGIAQPSLEERQLVFKPGLEATYDFQILNADRIHTYVAGDLAQYATIIDDAQDSGPRGIQARIKLPQELAPGRYEILIGAKELPKDSSMIGGVAAIQSRISILSLYDGVYPQFSFAARDVNINDKATFKVNVLNLGKQDIAIAQGIIDIYDLNNNSITTINTDIQSIPSNSNVELNATFDTSKFSLQPGIYIARARYTYNGIILNQTDEQKFMIGQMRITITDWSRTIYVNTTNKFTVNIESDWAADIKDVYAKIQFPNENRPVKTPNMDLIKDISSDKTTVKASTMLETYWETAGMNTGMTKVDVEIFYDKQTIRQTLDVNVTTSPIPILEQPKKFDMLAFKDNNIILLNMTIPMTVFLMIVLSIIVLFNIYYFAARKKKGGNSANVEPAINNMYNINNNGTSKVVDNNAQKDRK